MPAAWTAPAPTAVLPASAPGRTTRGRRALVAVAGLACLLVGGVGGYALGHAAGNPGSGGSTPAGSFTPGTGGGPGGGLGGFGGTDGDGGGFRHHDFPGTGPQSGSGGTAGGGTTGGTGTGTGGTGDGGTV